jgi:DNA-binding NarL/FixJ family response regulator
VKNPIQIFIADDHRLVLDGLATLIQSIDGFELAGKFNSGKDLLDSLVDSQTLPDICLVDIEMPGMDGIETVKKLRTKYPLLKIIALTMHEEVHFVNRMITAGVNGYLLKNIDRDVFEKCIQRIFNGEEFFTAGINEEYLKSVSSDNLSNRERQILKLIVLGKSNKEIAEELFISDRTADTHRTNIKRKLKLSSLADLIQFAKKNGYY